MRYNTGKVKAAQDKGPRVGSVAIQIQRYFKRRMVASTPIHERLSLQGDINYHQQQTLDEEVKTSTWLDV